MGNPFLATALLAASAVSLLAASAVSLPAGDAGGEIVLESRPAVLNYEELVLLSDNAEPGAPVREKLDRLLRTPFVGNAAHHAGTRPRRPELDRLGPALRVAVWNIERGSEFELIRLALSDPDGFLEEAGKQWTPDPRRLEEIRGQALDLKDSDVLILNEVDLGMTRSDYRDVAKELAASLGMNYAFGAEFVEVDKIELGLEELHAPAAADDEQFTRDLEVDKVRYRGLHGTAVLSRYPIRDARIFRFHACYDWYGSEKEEIAKLEKGRRLAADRLFLERISREVRVGNRMALIADLGVPESPTGVVTVAAVHLENKCTPKCRQQQMRELLGDLQAVRNPLILGGDLNTTGGDGAPMSIGREVAKRIKNPHFWSRQAITWLTPLSLPQFFFLPANYFKNYQDPTAKNIPVIATNGEKGLFSLMRKFRFADESRFDFRGNAERSVAGRKGTLSNSNERAAKGFTTTFSFKRDFKGLIGRMRLDWVIVKPPGSASRDPEEVHPFEPYFGRTLAIVNAATPDQISDHHPIVVDLPLTAGAAVSGRQTQARTSSPPAALERR
jgi:endonuclease/exonuclease/phosphatase family metal-dependent hydrolase